MRKLADEAHFCFLAAVVSGQSHQWQQDHWEGPAADQQSSQHCLADGGHYPTEQQYLSGGAVPSTEDQAGCTDCDQGHGGQAGSFGLPYAALRAEVPGPRSGVPRSSTPCAADQLSQGQSRQPRIPTHSNSGGLGREFLTRSCRLCLCDTEGSKRPAGIPEEAR